MDKLKYSPKELQEIAANAYPSARYLEEVSKLIQLYQDIDTAKMVNKLLGRTSATNNPPIYHNVLKVIVDRIAVAYDAPPVRMLISPSGDSLAPFSEQNKVLEAYLRDASWDAKWSEINAYKELLSTVFVRFYPSDHTKTVKPVLFMPDQVFRAPNPQEPDDISADSAFCLRLGEKEGDKFLYDYWELIEAGKWRSFIVEEDGTIVRRPFGETGEVPYSALPVLAIHNQAGALPMAYYPVKQSRIDSQLNVNKQWSDLDDIMGRQGFSSIVVKTEEPERFKDATISPDRGMTIRPDEDVSTLDYRPLLTESLNVVNDLIKVWLVTEGLPASDAEWVLYRSGPSESARMLPLREKRKKLLPLIKREQRIAYKIIAGIVQVKHQDWNKPSLDESLELDARSSGSEEIDSIDPAKVQASISEIKAGLSSAIEYLRTRYNISRQEAEDLYRQNQEDNAMFPLPGPAQ